MKGSLDEPIGLTSEYPFDSVLDLDFDWELALLTPCPKTSLVEQPLDDIMAFVVVGGGTQTEPVTQEIMVYKDDYADDNDINGIGCGGQTLTIEVDEQLIVT